MNSNVVNLYPVPTGGVADQPLLTVSNSAISLASSYDTKTRYIVLDVQDQDVRVTYDGSNPTTSNGHVLAAGTSYTWAKETALAAKVIRAGGTDAKIAQSEFTA